MMGLFTETMVTRGVDYCVAEETRSSQKERGMSIRRRLRVRFMLIVVFALAGSHALPGQRPAQNAPGRAKSLSCVFSVMTTANWKNGESVAEIKSAKLSMEYDTIEPQE
jgi:hypothetical protein